MSNVKSIRKCNNKVTAKDLGVKVGDKFIVLPQSSRFEGMRHNDYGDVGDTLIFTRDDGSDCPMFF